MLAMCRHVRLATSPTRFLLMSTLSMSRSAADCRLRCRSGSPADGAPVGGPDRAAALLRGERRRLEDCVSRRLREPHAGQPRRPAPPCRRCVFWELDPVAREAAEEAGDVALEKEAWVSATLLEWGSCGKLVYVDSMPAGYLAYAPPVTCRAAVAFPTSPVSGDAVLLMTGRRAAGVHRRRPGPDARAGRRQGPDPARGAGDRGVRPDAPATGTSVAAGSCVRAGRLPARGGLQDGPAAPPLPAAAARPENALSWREDVEVALERLLGSMNPEPAFRPV